MLKVNRNFVEVVVIVQLLSLADSLRPHGLQHDRLPCPPLSPRVCSDPCPLNQWCHPTISSSATPFSSCPQSFPASGSFPVSGLFISGSRSIGASASASVNIRGWFPLGLTDLFSLMSKWLSRVQHHNFKTSIFWCSAYFLVQLSHPYITTRKTIALTRWTFVSKVMSLLFNMLSRFVIGFLPRRKYLLISWLQSPPAVILEPRKIKSVPVSTVFPSICHEVMGPDAKIFIFWMLSFKPAFSLTSFTFIKRLFGSFSLSAITLLQLHRSL